MIIDNYYNYDDDDVIMKGSGVLKSTVMKGLVFKRLVEGQLINSIIN